MPPMPEGTPVIVVGVKEEGGISKLPMTTTAGAIEIDGLTMVDTTSLTSFADLVKPDSKSLKEMEGIFGLKLSLKKDRLTVIAGKNQQVTVAISWGNPLDRKALGALLAIPRELLGHAFLYGLVGQFTKEGDLTPENFALLPGYVLGKSEKYT